MMGYSMSKHDLDPDKCDLTSGSSSASAASSSARGKTPLVNNNSNTNPLPSSFLDHDIAHLTRLRSAPPPDVLNRRLSPYSSTVRTVFGREANLSGKGGRFSHSDRCHVMARYLPVHGPYQVDQMDSSAYVSQFSVDGSLFVAGFQGSRIRIYNVERGWRVQKDVLARSMGWAITDTSLSPDQRLLVYASISPMVHVVNVGTSATESYANVTEIHDGLDLSVDGDGDMEYNFGIFSVKFSTDGREIVAGSNDEAIYLYDLEANKLTLRVSAHKNDVNTVCFADETGHVIYSGGDDYLCKVWDRRCLNAKGQPSGVLVGHLEGITFLDSRGDGRYLISNGKDQCTKLWDIRRMSSNDTCVTKIRRFDWDYRWMPYPPQARHLRHPCDQSLATYRGHSVLRTLIRCYFSPAHSTGQKYIYTGSNDGNIYIYDVVTGDEVAKLEYHRDAVRDCSWHPEYPMLASSSWDGEIARWEFPGSEGVPKPVRRTRRRRAYF